MQFSENWLRTWVNPPISTEALSHMLTMAGLEVEEVSSVAPPFSGVVVARVLEVAKHPNADRLHVCQVDVGTGSSLNIVCGAPNVRAGLKVACATVGANLPGENGAMFEIKPVKMRGVESHGMLCSARELGVSEESSGLLELPDDAPVGKDFRAYRELDDALYTLKLTPNRADCLSLRGVAREVATLTQAPLETLNIAPVAATIKDGFPVRISDPQGCGRFAGRVMRNVNAHAHTPDWMKERLARSGQRSISALVDVTNYVMLELGQPLHVYDLAKLQGGIDVRFGRKGETLKLLNEQIVELSNDVLAITDARGPIGLAGIMGGDSTKAELETRNIYLESAFFYPNAIAGRARRFNFSSDASHRFERGVDFARNVEALERATRLILEICGGEVGPVNDVVAQLPERKPVRMRSARAAKIIGLKVPDDEIAGIFERLDFAVTRDGEGFVVVPPSHRFDIEIEEDLIEEVARVYGFERIPSHPPIAPTVMRAQPEGRRTSHALRSLLADRDFQEVVNFSFVDEAWEADFAANAAPLRLLNPIASQMSVMRSSLIGGLVDNTRYNINRKAARVRVFELGRVFLRAADVQDGELSVAGIAQPMRIAALAFGGVSEEQWGEPFRLVDFYDLKADVEVLLAPLHARFVKAAHPALHPGRSARIEVNGVAIGWIGELHPQWQHKYDLPTPAVVFELDVEPLLQVGVSRYVGVSKVPAVTRDRAVLVDDKVAAQALLDALESARPAFVQEVTLFDLYRGKGVPEGKKSLAFRVVMQDTARTLTDAEVDAAMAKMTEVLVSRFGAQQRI
ncbi:MAG TPA: phenylalanine--tRNA ligase subunit beta [Burkholderiales bacterium]